MSYIWNKFPSFSFQSRNMAKIAWNIHSLVFVNWFLLFVFCKIHVFFLNFLSISMHSNFLLELLCNHWIGKEGQCLKLFLLPFFTFFRFDWFEFLQKIFKIFYFHSVLQTLINIFKGPYWFSLSLHIETKNISICFLQNQNL